MRSLGVSAASLPAFGVHRLKRRMFFWGVYAAWDGFGHGLKGEPFCSSPAGSTQSDWTFAFVAPADLKGLGKSSTHSNTQSSSNSWRIMPKLCLPYFWEFSPQSDRGSAVGTGKRHPLKGPSRRTRTTTETPKNQETKPNQRKQQPRTPTKLSGTS